MYKQEGEAGRVPMDGKGGRVSIHTVTPDRMEFPDTRILLLLMPPSQRVLDLDFVKQCGFVYRTFAAWRR